jgi:hypothetical protein
MLITDLDGVSHKWNLTGNMARGKIANKSSFHIKARNLITSHYPTLQILEEVPIPLKKGDTLYLDFYLPLKKLCIEVHGEQHYKFVGFYHGNMLNFLKSKKRDVEKQEWCELNGITHIVFPHFEDENQWTERLNNA